MHVEGQRYHSSNTSNFTLTKSKTRKDQKIKRSKDQKQETKTMKFSSILFASLIQATVYATEPEDKQHLRRTVESQTLEHTKGPHKHEPRGEKKKQKKKSSERVTYFTLDGKKANTGNTKQHNNEREGRIVGGTQSSPGDFPYYVDLDGCGGSLIAPNVVLTAAHCGSFQGATVIVGAYRAGSTDNNAVSVSVSADVPHPNYDDFTLANDFRLLRLSNDVTVGGSNVVLSINGQSSRPSAGEDLTVLGLGLTSEGGSSPDILRDVEIQAISTNTCNQASGYGGDVENDIMFCAGVSGGGKDSCQGDSGRSNTRSLLLVFITSCYHFRRRILHYLSL